MKRTTLEGFREELLRTGGYVSAPERMAAKPRKPGWWTTLTFTWSVFRVFPMCSIWEAMGRLSQDKWAEFCFGTLTKAEALGVPVTMEGWEGMAAHKGPVVYVSNHMSTLETIMLPFVLQTFGPFNTVVKNSLSHLPFLEKAAAHMGLVPVGRKNPREDLMRILEAGRERVGRGESFLIFAQGTRKPVFAKAGWSSIGAKLAEKCGVPLVPVAVKTDIQPTRPEGKGWAKDFGTVDTTKDIRVACGPLLTGKARETHGASFEWLKAKLDSWGLPTDGGEGAAE